MPRPFTRARSRACTTLARACAVAVLAVVPVVAGCARMDAALGKQWLVVQFNPNTTITAARQVTKACSHVPNVTHPQITADKADTGMVEQVRYNVSTASDANMARLQICLQRFRSVQGVTLNDSSGY